MPTKLKSKRVDDILAGVEFATTVTSPKNDEKPKFTIGLKHSIITFIATALFISIGWALGGFFGGSLIFIGVIFSIMCILTFVPDITEWFSE